MGLHESNSTVRGQILLMNPPPTVSQAYAFVKQDEKARQGYQSLINQPSPFANALSLNTGNVNAAAASTTYKKFNSGSASKSPLKCTFCNFNGHTKETCYKLIGCPPNWKKKKDIATSNSSLGSAPLGSASQFRALPQPNQANSAVLNSSQSQDQITQMQSQINQLMNLLIGTGKATNSPEDHLAGIVISRANLVASHNSSFAWLIDTGATDHMLFFFFA